MAAPALTLFPHNGDIESRHKLDEASGNRADSVGSLTLTDGNTVGAGAGYSNDGGVFDNSADLESANNNYLRASNPGSAVWNGNQDFSLGIWLNPESLPASANQWQIASKWADTDAERCWDLDYRNNSGTHILRFSNQNGASLVSKSVTHTLSTSTWARILVAFDLSAGAVKFYKDGSILGTQQTGLNTTVNASASAEVTLGAIGNTPTQFYDGLMQDTIFWANRLLTDDEAQEEYEVYTTAPASGGVSLLMALMSLSGMALGIANVAKDMFVKNRVGLLVPGWQLQMGLPKADVERKVYELT